MISHHGTISTIHCAQLPSALSINTIYHEYHEYHHCYVLCTAAKCSLAPVQVIWFILVLAIRVASIDAQKAVSAPLQIIIQICSINITFDQG